jgi:hypothetical protein
MGTWHKTGYLLCPQSCGLEVLVAAWACVVD